MGESFLISMKVAMSALADALVLLAIIFIGRIVYRLTMRIGGKAISLQEQIASRTAMGVALTGYFLGLAVAISGILDPGSPWAAISSPWEKLCLVAAVGVISIILMRISLIINNKFILRKFSNMNEIVNEGNVGVAWVEAGGCIATGFIIAGFLSVRADNMYDQTIYGLAYWLIGQIALVIGAMIFRLMCEFKLDEEIGDNNNEAAGLAFGGFLVAIGLVIQAALTEVHAGGDCQKVFLPELVTIFVVTIVGMLLLVFGGLGLNKVIMSKTPVSGQIKNKNVGAGMLAAASFICVATIYSASIWASISLAADNATRQSTQEIKTAEPNTQPPKTQ